MEQVDAKLRKPVIYGTDEDPLTVVTVAAEVAGYEARVTTYNKAKKNLDHMQNELLEEEAEVASVAGRVLSSAKGKFKNDSSLVGMVGGIRTSDRKAPRKKVITPMPGDLSRSA